MHFVSSLVFAISSQLHKYMCKQISAENWLSLRHVAPKTYQSIF